MIKINVKKFKVLLNLYNKLVNYIGNQLLNEFDQYL